MAELDRTFTSDDLIRLYLNNLDPGEQRMVEDFFTGLDFNVLEELADVLSETLELIPLIGDVLEVIGVVSDTVEFVSDVRQKLNTVDTVQRLLIR